ncbi:caspase, EACC1-associated type [Nostoc punctiforme]|uniref:GUN4 domain protein n=1 Tax=Nostoc punctiforme (strain ATCC 29133 / PCC 73102) TaxID=63737 RepID=B2J7X9_NOSP7|nr:GUN4 domain-containing protein [Nostoc punctiforme]ACC83944.1 GUN4 domain protein [Nostoc punctiforme PCC 73102]
MSKKIALLIGVSEYGEGIPPLSSALNDVEAMQRVLQNPNLGGFEQIERLLNPDAIAMRKAIQKLFREAGKDDLVLFFFSGHGITNDEDHLYLATRNTAKEDFEATAVDANFIRGQSNNCYAKRQVLILDACYSGAIAQGWRTKSVGVDIKKQLGAEGRVVLTSSSATQTSFEQEGSTLSLYTQYLVEGIETGAADKDNDGNIYVHELHAYAKAKVKIVKSNMTPDIILDKEGYNIFLAHAPKNPEAEYRKLVEKYVKEDGELDEFAFLILKPKRKTFELTDEKAEKIETDVLEPLRRRVANLKSYKQAFAKAVEQKYPLYEFTLNKLKDYQQDILGLRDEDVAQIELEITSIKEAEYQKQLQIQKQQEKEEYGNNLRRYEQKFKKAVQAQYPLDEYVHNGLKQFQQLLGLKNEHVKRIEEIILAPIEEAERIRQQQEGERLKRQREEAKRLRLQREQQKAEQVRQQEAETLQRPRQQKNDDLISENGVDYTRLHDLLKAGKWKEADQETLAVMLKATGREKDGWLSSESIENFPCTDLRTIDQLWVKYSNGRFGFSVQKRIWESVGRDYDKFGDRISWRKDEKVVKDLWFGFKQEETMEKRWLDRHEITYTTSTSYGHLPWLPNSTILNTNLFSRVQTCSFCPPTNTNRL